ncbi:hypothetical protein DL546_009364 [Coniochaeta pulveracea]|uniref:Copper-fist domain-containing protein n=1 Tax=Coniochaeta pulveracea TaxID=177199 RepID=A0A420YLA4_9PEZI|nr:hypothetical protein DL546_009364 [Coniochaeta pulveracea]
MPLIDGKKMACTPCIRGHRSTKCNHANERVMVPVRKPGRPLSSCACPPGRSCTCGGLKVAIPRKKNCYCEGPNSEHGPHESHHPRVKPEVVTPAQTPSLMPTSPRRAAKQTAFRIQKSKSTTNTARTSSIYAPALDRIDPAQVNIIINPTAIGTAQYHGQPVQTSDSHPNETPRGGCCGGGESRNGSSPNIMPTQPPQQAVDNIASPFSTHHSQSVPPQILSYGSPPLLPQGTMYYPPQYGTWEQPITMSGYALLQLQQLQQHQTEQAILAQQRLHLQLAGQAPQQLQLEQALLPRANGDPASMGSMHNTPQAIDGLGQGISHQCGCGPGCECIGCVSHPFNAQTLQYVNDAYDVDLGKTTVDMLGGSNNGVAQHQAQVNSTHATTNGTTLPTPPHYQAQMQDPESLSPQVQVETPSDASGLGEEQTFPASDFLFIDVSSCHAKYNARRSGGDGRMNDMVDQV